MNGLQGTDMSPCVGGEYVKMALGPQSTEGTPLMK